MLVSLAGLRSAALCSFILLCSLPTSKLLEVIKTFFLFLGGWEWEERIQKIVVTVGGGNKRFS